MKKPETNKRIYTVDNVVIKQWEIDVGMKFKDIITHIIDLGNTDRRREFYKTIPYRHNYRKPLSDCKIDKSKVCIQK